MYQGRWKAQETHYRSTYKDHGAGGNSPAPYKRIKEMKIFYLFPVILIVIDVGAAVIYLFNGDKARALYWVSAASITLSTLFIGVTK